jgi:hypothetical protein
VCARTGRECLLRLRELTSSEASQFLLERQAQSQTVVFEGDP